MAGASRTIARLPPIARLNDLPADQFGTAIRPLFEGAPRFVARLAAGRPYRSYEQLLRRGLEVALEMPEEEQLELIDGHPRIGAVPASISALSYREQGYDREPAAAAALQAELDELNDAYERRFGFRFLIFVAGRSRSAIVPIMRDRLTAERDEEKERALRDVFAIARDRVSKSGAALEEE